jgi:hypothetical protein
MHRERCAVSSDCRRDAPCLHMLEGLDLALLRPKRGGSNPRVTGPSEKVNGLHCLTEGVAKRGLITP